MMLNWLIMYRAAVGGVTRWLPIPHANGAVVVEADTAATAERYYRSVRGRDYPEIRAIPLYDVHATR